VSFGLAAPLRDVAKQLVDGAGESAILTRTTVTDVPSTGATSTSEALYTVTAARIEPKSSFAAAIAEALGTTFVSGSRVAAADERAILAARGLAIVPAAGDQLTWGTTDVAGNRRAVVAATAYRVEGQDVAYLVELKK
jgi:hypothetical protein